MRRLIALAAAAALAGCASGITKSTFAPSQNWRAADGTPVLIEGGIARVADGLSHVNALFVRFNGEIVLRGQIARDLSGEVSGGTWQGSPVLASCSSRPISNTQRAAACMVFVGNERTVTLSF